MKLGLQDILDNYQTMIDDIDINAFDDGDKENKQKIISKLCVVAREFSSYLHYIKQEVDWNIPPNPEWFDHFCDQHFQFSNHRNAYWLERGVYSSLVLFPTANVLELCCGDGYNAYHFYSNLCNNIYAIDFDKTAHDHATTHFNGLSNLTFKLGDIRYDIPDDNFDVVIWDAAIEHFTEDEIFSIMNTIKDRLGSGILTGHTIKELDSGVVQLHQHEREFISKEDLAQFFVPYFKNVLVFETIHPERHNYYFYASDSIIPFSSKWNNGLMISGD
jgi:protein-L-isoaspartate O-methyltransferase